eukprot:3607600-Karenia_brevis.AAC.1
MCPQTVVSQAHLGSPDPAHLGSPDVAHLGSPDAGQIADRLLRAWKPRIRSDAHLILVLQPNVPKVN